jgi:hypothetical protein
MAAPAASLDWRLRNESINRTATRFKRSRLDLLSAGLLMSAHGLEKRHAGMDSLAAARKLAPHPPSARANGVFVFTDKTRASSVIGANPTTKARANGGSASPADPTHPSRFARLTLC